MKILDQMKVSLKFFNAFQIVNISIFCFFECHKNIFNFPKFSCFWFFEIYRFFKLGFY